MDQADSALTGLLLQLTMSQKSLADKNRNRFMAKHYSIAIWTIR